MPKVALLTVGDELLIGQVIDTNSSWMAQTLDQNGYQTVTKTTCSDDQQDILQCINECLAKAPILLITGGLGPTHDDLTRFALAQWAEEALVLNQEALAELQRKYTLRNRELTDSEPLQCMLPKSASQLLNPIGTAAGILLQKEGKLILAFPGVPREMKVMLSEVAMPILKTSFPPEARINKVVMTATLPESALAKRIAPWQEALPSHIKLAYLPAEGCVRLRLSGTSADALSLEQELLKQVEMLLPYAEDLVFALEDKPLHVVLGELLKEKQQTLAIAESCTGGYIQHLMTLESGSSAFMLGGMTTYSNDAKANNLHVSMGDIEQYGAVSQSVVEQMAINIRAKHSSDWSVATSGVAGPTGGTAEKPVGTVWIATCGKEGVQSHLLQLTQDRELNIKLSTTHVLFRLWQRVKQGA